MREARRPVKSADHQFGGSEGQMPLFAYRCSDCAHQFETLSRFDEIPECPACGGAHVERQLSLIARPAAGGEPAESCAAMAGGAPCPSCPALAGQV
ncbi:zinc ribbon domain-containing protein [Methylocystis rosea]|uniref:Zinc ribbon domain-containing protein n=2 Tax=Methylocystis rosea TaxID=173366 RepID=A0A3G8M7T9_9HYPH|nr:zinc ribbon domain-containing protein [Methylocystis rosea]